jgi:hypothetical protein
MRWADCIEVTLCNYSITIQNNTTSGGHTITLLSVTLHSISRIIKEKKIEWCVFDLCVLIEFSCTHFLYSYISLMCSIVYIFDVFICDVFLYNLIVLFVCFILCVFIDL